MTVLRPAGDFYLPAPHPHAAVSLSGYAISHAISQQPRRLRGVNLGQEMRPADEPGGAESDESNGAPIPFCRKTLFVWGFSVGTGLSSAESTARDWCKSCARHLHPPPE